MAWLQGSLGAHGVPRGFMTQLRLANLWEIKLQGFGLKVEGVSEISGQVLG